jgi:hypothetical protein
MLLDLVIPWVLLRRIESDVCQNRCWEANWSADIAVALGKKIHQQQASVLVLTAPAILTCCFKQSFQ